MSAVVIAVSGGVAAADAATSVKACVNKKTLAVRIIPAKKKCTKAERVVSWSVAGPQGEAGTKGDTGPTGATGATGASSVKITELSVCDGTDAGTVADELCKIGMTGPGGGPVFYIDYQDQFASFCAGGVDCNYLEASPTDVDEAGNNFTSAWCSNVSSLQNFDAWRYRAIGAGRANTISLDITCSSGAVQVASDYTAPAFNGVAKDDWWLPSLGELSAIYANLGDAGVGGFAAVNYWSSSESSAGVARAISFETGFQDPSFKSNTERVRPVRGF